LAWLAGTLVTPAAATPVTRHSSLVTPVAKAVPGYRLRFPHDEGSHPDFRLEWWYLTGWLDAATEPLGFQVTFFRVRPALRLDNPSAFTPRQIVIAHAALSDPREGRLVHAQRSARTGHGLAGADEGKTRVWVDDWRLLQEANFYHAIVRAETFSLELAFTATQPPLLQGNRGYSRKGPDAASASHYYSLPQLKVGGTVLRAGKARKVGGVAWLDHEWSSQYLEKDAAGWDWIGINLDDGSALMAFRMRGKNGSSLWAGGTLRRANGTTLTLGPGEVTFTPRREWRSGRTGTTYPLAWTVQAGELALAVEPLFDDQEHDTRASTGTIYWEGAVRASRDGKPAGLGYLELTGYWRRPSL
jgi:predicted secreted hydrolase